MKPKTTPQRPRLDQNLDPATVAPRRIHVWGAAILLIVATLLAYANSFGGVFIFDDVNSILKNPRIRHLWPITMAMSAPPQSSVAGRPVIALSLAFNYALGGLETWGYHAFNLAVHLLCGLLLFGIVRRTLSGPRLKEHYERSATTLGMIVALLWLIHPLQTESVTYIITRTEVLMGFFCLLTLYCAMRASRSFRPTAWHVAAVISSALGMACKEVMVVVPLLVLFYDRVFESPSIAQALRRRWGLYAGLAATWLFLAALNASSPRSASVGFAHGVTAFGYAKNQCLALITYLRLAFWPHPLIFDYGFPKTLSIREVLPQGLAVVGLLIATLAALRVRPMIGFLGAWFFIILAPTSSFVPISTEVAAERRMYLPLAALVVLVVLAVDRLVRPAAQTANRRRLWPAILSAACTLAVALALGLTTDRRNRMYHDAVGIWQQAIALNPMNARSQCSLGNILLDKRQFAAAEERYTKALAINPNYVDARHNLGVALVNLDRAAEAIPHYEMLLRDDPESPEVLCNFAVALAHLGRIDEAIQHLREAVRLAPGDAVSRCNLAGLLLQQNQVNEAIAQLSEAVRLQTGNTQARRLLGQVLAQNGRLPQAVEQFREVLRIEPNDAKTRSALNEALAKLNPPTAP